MTSILKTEEIQTVFKVPLSHRHLKIKQIKLQNGLNTILISNPQAQNSTAAMCVKSGYFEDPDNLPGLAHLCEHMLFAGTKRFPGKTTYYDSVLKHGGSCNAYTLSDSTTFQLTVPSKSMHDEIQPEFFHLLKMFASQFHCPSFNISSIKEEISVVDQEHKANIGNLEKSFLHILKSFAKHSHHPFAKFSTGNFETLLSQNVKVLRYHLKSYFKENFCADNMSLVIHSDQSLHTLQKLVTIEFSSIPSSLQQKKHLQVLPKNIISTKKFIHVEYDVDPINARIVFPINNSLVPPSFQRIWCDLLGNETKESLFNYLKTRGLITSIFVYLVRAYNGYNFFTMELSLTSKSINNPKLFSSIFTYLTKLSEFMIPKVVESYLQECCSIEKFNFFYSGPLSDEAELTRCMAENIEQRYILPENVIQGFNSISDELNDWNLLTRLFYCLTSKYLRVENCDIIVFSTETNLINFFSIGQKAVKYDKYYNLNFKLADLNIEKLQLDEIEDYFFEFNLLQPNSFMTMSNEQIDSLIIDLANQVSLAKNSITHDLPHFKDSTQPILFEISKNNEVWIKQIEDKGFNHEHITFQFLNSSLDRHPKNIIALKLVCKIIGENLSRVLYPSEILGYCWKIIPVISGTMSITVSISGQPHGVNKILKLIVEEIRITMTNICAFSYLHFREPRISLRKELESMEKGDILTKVIAASIMFLEEGVWSAKQQLEALEEIEIQDIVELCQNFINCEIYTSSLIETKASGETSNKRVKELCGIIGAPIPSQSNNLCPSGPSSYLIPPGLNFKADIGLSFQDDNNFIHYYIQMGIRDHINTRTLTKMISKFIDSNAQIELRIKRNLGYQIYSGHRIYRKTIGLYIIAVSTSHSSSELIVGIDNFLLDMIQRVQDMSDIQYERDIIAPVLKFDDSTSETLGCGPINQNCELTSNIGSGTTPCSKEYIKHTGEWEKIISKSYTFNGANGEDEWDVNIVKQISKTEFAAIFELKCSPESKKRSVLLMHGDNARKALEGFRKSTSGKMSKIKRKSKRISITKLPYINTNLAEFHSMCNIVL